MPSIRPSEIWIALQYRYKGEVFRYNLPLPKGAKFLDGMRIDLEEREIPGGQRYVLTLETLGAVETSAFELTGRMDFGPELKSVFVNGYQSWTASRERFPGERIASLDWPGKLRSLQNLGDARFYPYSEKKGRFHGYTYAYVRFPDHLAFVGSVDESAGFTVITTDIRRGLFTIAKDVEGLRLDGNRTVLDILLLEGREDEVFDIYAGYWKPMVPPGPRAVSWIGGDSPRLIGETGIRRVLSGCAEKGIPLDYFRIERGWQRNLGDWGEPAAGFPSGMASLASEIRGSGYLPGIWMAPFVAGVDSSVFRTRREWFARDRGGRIRPAGRHPRLGGPYYALDVSSKDAMDYVSRSVRRMREEWGFELIEMDLLFAAALYPPEGMSRGEALATAMDVLESAKGDAVYRLNGVPLGAAFGRAEYCRVAADTTPSWEQPSLRNLHCRERASTVNALRSAVGRRHLDGRLLSADTDAIRLGRRRKGMEAGRRYTQFLLHALFGAFLCIADDVSGYGDDEFRLFASLFPKVGAGIEDAVESRRTVAVRYTVGERRFFSFSNLSDRWRSFVLPEGHWFCAPGLERRAHHLAGGRKLHLKPGESRNYLLLDEEDPFTGSDGHVFPGAEVASVVSDGSGWRVEPLPGGVRDFRVWIRAASEGPVFINGEEAGTVETPFGGRLAVGTIRCAEARR